MIDMPIYIYNQKIRFTDILRRCFDCAKNKPKLKEEYLVLQIG